MLDIELTEEEEKEMESNDKMFGGKVQSIAVTHRRY